MYNRFKGDDGTTITIQDTTISSKGERHSLKGVHAYLEDGSALESRITATRLLLFGPFALAMKKRKGGEKYLIVEGPDFAYMTMVKRQNISKAVRFKPEIVNAAAKCRNLPQSVVDQSEAARPARFEQPKTLEGQLSLAKSTRTLHILNIFMLSLFTLASLVTLLWPLAIIFGLLLFFAIRALVYRNKQIPQLEQQIADQHKDSLTQVATDLQRLQAQPAA